MSDICPLCAQKADMEYLPSAVLWGLIPSPTSHILSMTQWQKTPREPPKTKAELREMPTEAVRNTQSEPKRLPKAK
jgi:hypothetical protein